MAKGRHVLIIGVSESGKTTLGQQLAKRLKAAGHKIAVLDPFNDPNWQADFITTDSAEFMRYAKANRQHYLFIDEGGKAIGKYNHIMEWTTTGSRHWGHVAVLMTQGATQLDTIVRAQCSRVYLFWVPPKQAKAMGDEFGVDEFYLAPKLKQYHFYEHVRFGETNLLTLNLKEPKIPDEE